jgi:lysophospholipase L1-like esterase
MRLVAFGCSNTYGFALPQEIIGNELPLPSKYSWPAVLSNRLGVECVNKGIPAASNKLISHVLHNTKLYPTDIVVILWSYIDRWCVIEDPNYNEHDPAIKYSIATWDSDKRSRSYYKYIYNEVDHTIDTNYRIEYANLYLNNKGIKHHQTSCSSIKHPALIDIKFGELQNIDHAADGVHPGIEAHKAIAETLYKRIVQ